MTNRPLRIAAVSAVVVIAAWAILLNLWLKSDRTARSELGATHASAATGSVDGLITTIQSELPVDRLSVREVEGIVIIRGSAQNQSAIERITRMAKEVGFTRVANLVQVTPAADDEAIELRAERHLSQIAGLEGCRFAIDSSDGIVTLSGVVQRELQRDLARTELRRVAGVKEVRSNLRVDGVSSSPAGVAR
jgi:osmotically-inducible protein OsmY